MVGGNVVHCDLFAGMDVAQGHKENVTVRNSHVGVGPTAVIDKMCAVAAARAIEICARVDVADAVHFPALHPPRGLARTDALARVLGDLARLRKKLCGEAPAPVNF